MATSTDTNHRKKPFPSVSPDQLGRQTDFRKKSEVARRWHVVDAEGISLGRLASDIAIVLMGKHKPDYTPNVDTGDFVIVTNSKKVGLTGNKAANKLKTKYTGYAGGLKVQTFGQVREHDPERLVRDAVKRMLPKNRLGRQMLKKLKVYETADHPHTSVNATELKR